MTRRDHLTRRGILALTASLAASARATGDDVELLWLGQEFLRLAGQLDAVLDGPDSDDECVTLNQIMRGMDAIEDAIISQHATTIAGLRAKALVVNWAKCDDLNPDDIHYLAHRMVLSLIRDLVASVPAEVVPHRVRLDPLLRPLEALHQSPSRQKKTLSFIDQRSS